MGAPDRDILILLGELKKGLERVESAQEEERREAKESRSKIHARLDQHVRNVSEIEGKVILIGHAFETQRELIGKVADKVDANHAEVTPALKKWKQIETLGWGFSAVLLALGVTAGGVMMWAGDTAVSFARRWLKID